MLEVHLISRIQFQELQWVDCSLECLRCTLFFAQAYLKYRITGTNQGFTNLNVPNLAVLQVITT